MVITSIGNWILACNFKSCKEIYLLLPAIRTLRRSWEVSCCPLLPTPIHLPPLLKWGKNFFQKRDFHWRKDFYGKFIGVSMETWGVSLTCGQTSWRGLPGETGGRRNYLWCLVIFVIFMGLGGAHHKGGGQVINGGPIFPGGGRGNSWPL